MLEYHCSEDKTVPTRIFANAYSRFPNDVDFIVRYLTYLFSVNDETSASKYIICVDVSSHCNRCTSYLRSLYETIPARDSSPYLGTLGAIRISIWRFGRSTQAGKTDGRSVPWYVFLRNVLDRHSFGTQILQSNDSLSAIHIAQSTQSRRGTSAQPLHARASRILLLGVRTPCQVSRIHLQRTVMGVLLSVPGHPITGRGKNINVHEPIHLCATENDGLMAGKDHRGGGTALLPKKENVNVLRHQGVKSRRRKSLLLCLMCYTGSIVNFRLLRFSTVRCILFYI